MSISIKDCCSRLVLSNSDESIRLPQFDQTRYVEGAVESLLRTLKWAKLDYDEGVSLLTTLHRTVIECSRWL